MFSRASHVASDVTSLCYRFLKLSLWYLPLHFTWSFKCSHVPVVLLWPVKLFIFCFFILSLLPVIKLCHKFWIYFGQGCCKISLILSICRRPLKFVWAFFFLLIFLFFYFLWCFFLEMCYCCNWGPLPM